MQGCGLLVRFAKVVKTVRGYADVGVSDVRMSWSQKPISHAPVQMHEIGFVEATRVTDSRRYAATRSRV
jgi:hypothetical protein